MEVFSLVFTIIIILITASIVMRIIRGFNSSGPKPIDEPKDIFQHYQLQPSLFSAAELKLDKLLRLNLPENTVLHGKVRYADIYKVKPVASNLAKNEAFGLRQRISPRHTDWAICDLNGNFLCLIELDDKSHDNNKARKADAFKNNLAKRMNLQLHRVRVGGDYKKFIEMIAENIRLQK